MVVIIIIMILLTIALVSFSNVRSQNRDKVRKTDLAEYQLAVKLYYEQNGTYPDYPNGIQLGVGNPIDAMLSPYLPALPTDPNGAEQYWYDSVF